MLCSWDGKPQASQTVMTVMAAYHCLKRDSGLRIAVWSQAPSVVEAGAPDDGE